MDLSDIISARESLNLLEEARRNFAATLAAEQRQFVASRDFLAERRREITVARDELSLAQVELKRRSTELSLARAELERRSAELQERERGLAQYKAAIDASGTAEQLQEQLAELRAELDRDRVQHEQEREQRMADWHRNVASHEEELRRLNDRIHDLEAANEGLQKELADTADRAETARTLSHNSTLELERLVKIAWTERDDTLTRQREAEESAKKS